MASEGCSLEEISVCCKALVSFESSSWSCGFVGVGSIVEEGTCSCPPADCG